MNTIIPAGKPKLLYVDDERPNLTAFRVLLRDRYEVLTAENAEDAYLMLRKHDIPLIVSDQRMPGMSGTELLARVADDFPDSARMILTGYSDIDAVIDGINRSHIYYYFKKPWNEAEVRLTLENALEFVMTRRRLLESERRFRSAFENAGVGIAYVSPAGEILRANTRLQQFLSMSEPQLLGKAVESLFPEIWPDVVTSIIDGGPQDLFTRETSCTTSQGERWYRLAWTSSQGKRGVTDYLILIVDDLTERKKMEAELAASVSEWENTFDSVNDVIWILDSEQKIIRANRSVETVFGLTPAETLSKTCRDVARCNCERDQCPLVRMKKTLVRENAELQIGERFFWISVDPMLDASGNYTGSVHILSDITLRKQIERERDMLRENLRQSQKLEAIGSLAGGIAHDFNNLLTPIIGYSEIMERKFTEDDTKKMTRAITRAALSAKQLTGQLLAFGRKQVLEMKHCDINEVICSFEEIMRRIIRENIQIDISLAQGNLVVMADKGQLVQILLNLVVNAQDSISSLGTITMETSEVLMSKETARMYPGMTAGSYALLMVSDTGCGMDAETLSHIFEPFFTTKGVGHGTGLGLATVYGIVKQHEGFIYVDSRPGEGSVFRIYLPICDSCNRPSDAVDHPPMEFHNGKGKILLVEDNCMVREILTESLTDAGYCLYVAANPVEALDIAAEISGPFLLLTDVVMPEMNGNELFKALSSSHPNIRVLYISGYPRKAGEVDEVLDGAPFLPKPFTTQALLEHVQKLI